MPEDDTARLSTPGALYTAFVSYASRFDSPVVEDLERFIEGFHANRLVPIEHRKVMKICRDASDFPFLARLTREGKNPQELLGLVEVIRSFLRNSEYFIVFVRPESREHPLGCPRA